jgi:hypothetical protein
LLSFLHPEDRSGGNPSREHRLGPDAVFSLDLKGDGHAKLDHLVLAILRIYQFFNHANKRIAECNNLGALNQYMSTMKKFLYLFITIGLASANLCSQNSVIAVQNGGTPQFFYTFQDALSAATNGDTLYLPAGIFAIPAAIQKELHFVGRGHYPSESSGSGISRITGNVIIQEGADGSSFEGVYLDNVIIANGTGANIFITISDLSFIRSNFAGITMGGQYTDSNNPVNNVSQIYISECVVRGIVTAREAQNVVIEKSIFDSYLAGFNGQATVEHSVFLSRPLLSNSGIAFNNSIFLYNVNNFLQYEANNIFNNCVFVYDFSSGLGTNLVNNSVTKVDAAGVFEDVTGSAFAYTHNYQLKEGSPATGVGIGDVDAGIYGPDQPYTDGITSYPFIHEIMVPGTTDADGILNIQVKVSARDY